MCNGSFWLKRKSPPISWIRRTTPDHDPLIVYGARQAGKTYAIHDFFTKKPENVIEIDFKKRPEFKAIFAEGREIDRVMKCISLIELSFKAVSQGIGPLPLVRRLIMKSIEN